MPHIIYKVIKALGNCIRTCPDSVRHGDPLDPSSTRRQRIKLTIMHDNISKRFASVPALPPCPFPDSFRIQVFRYSDIQVVDCSSIYEYTSIQAFEYSSILQAMVSIYAAISIKLYAPCRQIAHTPRVVGRGLIHAPINCIA